MNCEMGLFSLELNNNGMQIIEDEQPPSKYDRTYPPFSPCDTIEIIPGRSIKSAYPKFLCFQDKEIAAIRYRALQPPEVMKNERGKTMLQQQSTNGDAAACIEMLLSDRGLPIDWSYMQGSSFECTRDIIQRIQNKGFSPVVDNVPLTMIQRILDSYGSALIRLDCHYNAHMVVLDKIDYQNSLAYIREPYHGWAIAVKLQPFYDAIGTQKPELIQICKKVALSNLFC